MTWLLYIFAAYLACCYVWAIYLAVRLYTGKRLRVLLLGNRLSRSSRVGPAAASRDVVYTPAEPAVTQRKAAA